MGRTMWITIDELILVFFFCNRYVLTTLSIQNPELYEGVGCKLKNGNGEGICVRANACPQRIQQISGDYYGAPDHCGFQNFTVLYCCERSVFERSTDQVRRAETACQKHREILKEINVFDYVGSNSAEFSHMAALDYTESVKQAVPTHPLKPGRREYFCVGTLISEKHVLTAAHCVSNIFGLIPNEVLLGTTDLRYPDARTMQRIPISRITKHPQHTPNLFYHDVAILELWNPIEFTVHVYPMCLMTKPLTEENMDEDTYFSITGYASRRLSMWEWTTEWRKADGLELVDKTECSQKNGKDWSLIPNGLGDEMICVSDPYDPNDINKCIRDTGGPFLLSSASPPVLAGITSLGHTVCDRSKPGVYTLVYKYLDWIEDQAWPISN